MELFKFRDKLARLQAELKSEAASIGERVGLGLAADVADRVIQRGETADGGSFTPYSRTDSPAFFYRGKSRRSSAEAAVQKAQKARTPLNYAGFRELNGLQSAHKSFEFTGEMWRNFTVTSARFDGRVIHVTLGGKSPASAQKIDWMSGQEKRDIIEPAPDEIAFAEKTAARNVQAIFDKNLR